MNKKELKIVKITENRTEGRTFDYTVEFERGITKRIYISDCVFATTPNNELLEALKRSFIKAYHEAVRDDEYMYSIIDTCDKLNESNINRCAEGLKMFVDFVTLHKETKVTYKEDVIKDIEQLVQSLWVLGANIWGATLILNVKYRTYEGLTDGYKHETMFGPITIKFGNKTDIILP